MRKLQMTEIGNLTKSPILRLKQGLKKKSVQENSKSHAMKKVHWAQHRQLSCLAQEELVAETEEEKTSRCPTRERRSMDALPGVVESSKTSPNEGNKKSSACLPTGLCVSISGVMFG